MHSPFAGSTSSQQAHFPWPNKEDYAHEHLTCDGHVVKPTIYARMEKGFQMIGGFWTCYRRNYFEVSCAFVLNPFCSNACIMLRGKQVQAFGMGISACVFDRDVNIDERRRVDILQFTPKRDTNDKRDLTIVRVWPGMPLQSHGGHGQRSLPYYATSRGPAFVPVLPYQGGSSRENSPHSGSPQRYPHDALPLVDHAGDGLYKQHTFDRLQFKTATANNGKRRASQQYYCLKIGLYADTRDDGASDPVWHRISEVFSEPLVVRGRSPNHYKNEDSGQDADEREGGEPGPSAHRTASFGRHTGYSYAHHYDSPDESRSRSNVGGFRGYGDNPDNSTPPDGSSESSMTPGDNIVSHFDQMGDDVKEEIRDGYHDAPGMNNYSYAPAPFTEPLSGPLPTDHQYQDSHNRLAYRMEHPGSLAAPRWEELDDSAMYRPATLQAFPSSEGFYPLNMTNDLTGSIDLFSRPDTAFQVHTQLHEQ
ncbi:p53-like transcription factor [Myriangium duriaei CBS 260.36]|uniref:P53-like transcription factor n=1 Tax=Myriangium duriaei CBS 260.36 TaxID=1168546 RepID=A0A9P4J033_9PEZI|nr:p53-like transcription factor [Myriangium duriaei CBS 260.36]